MPQQSLIAQSSEIRRISFVLEPAVLEKGLQEQFLISIDGKVSYLDTKNELINVPATLKIEEFSMPINIQEALQILYAYLASEMNKKFVSG